MLRRLFLKGLAAVPFSQAFAAVTSATSPVKPTSLSKGNTMPMAAVNDVNLCYQQTGTCETLVWAHEYGGDLRSWEPQVRHFCRRYRVITYNHRGYSPSTIPSAANGYSEDLLVEDLHQLLKHLSLGPVHLGGCSMGANVARDFAIAHPEMTRSLILLGAGAGSVNREKFVRDEEAIAAGLEHDGIESLVKHFQTVPNRASDALPFSGLWYAGPEAANNAIDYAKHRSRSHDAVIRVYDDAGNVIETHEHKGEFKEW